MHGDTTRGEIAGILQDNWQGPALGAAPTLNEKS